MRVLQRGEARGRRWRRRKWRRTAAPPWPGGASGAGSGPRPGALDGAESFLRAALGLEVFAERGLVTLERREDMMIVRPRPGCRADLEQSAYMRRLRRILGQDEKGAK